MPRDQDRWVLFALLVLCVTMRLVVIAKYHDDLSDDRDAYLRIGQSIWSGNGFTTFGPKYPTAFRPPLYPILIAPISQPQQQLARGLFNLMCGVGTVWTVWLIGNNLSLSLFSRTMSCTLICLDPLLLRYTAFPMTESLCTLLTAMWLWRMTLPSSSPRSAFLTGVLFGLAVLCRPTVWAVGGLYLLMLLIHKVWLRALSIFQSSSGWTKQHYLCCALGIAFVVSPWALRNWMRLGKPILMTTHGGYTILLGNNAAFYREVVQQPWGTVWDGSHGPGQQGWVLELNQQMAELGVTSEVERDRYQSRLAKETIVQQPVLFLQSCALRVSRFWSVRPTGPAAEGISPLVLWGIAGFYLVTWVLMGIGLSRVVRSRHAWRECLPLFALILALTCVHAIYWSNARMRAPTMPAIVLLAGFALKPVDRTKKSV